MLRSANITFLLILSFMPPCFAQIIQTDDFKVIQQKLQTADHDSLVIFDVDNVILDPKDQIFHYQNKAQLHDLYSTLAKTVPEGELQNLWSEVDLVKQEELVDSRILETLQNLRQRNIQTIALTHCGTGRFGKIDKFEDLRISTLKKHGIDFSKESTIVDHEFREITSSEWGTPLFKSGIAFTGSVDKGVMLKALLDNAGLHPKKVIFIDDKHLNIYSVARILHEKKIEFLGIEYTASKNAPNAPLDVERAKLQFAILEKERRWLSDKEADERSN